MREEAKRTVRGGASVTAGGVRQHAEAVESGLSRLRMKSAEGGDSKAKRVKNELNYLINNYLPRYDARIETLISDWRTSGDPSYDPSIRGRLRRARQQHMKKNAL